MLAKFKLNLMLLIKVCYTFKFIQDKLWLHTTAMTL